MNNFSDCVDVNQFFRDSHIFLLANYTRTVSTYFKMIDGVSKLRFQKRKKKKP